MARIVEVASSPLVRELHTPFVTALRSTTQVVSIAVRVTDSDGVEGFGEAPQVWRVTGESQASIQACVHGPLAPVLLGRDLDDSSLADISAGLAAVVVANGGARAAIEVAAADLAARRAGLSLARHLGAAVDAVVTDVTIAADGLAAATSAAVAAGFGSLKVKVGLDPADVQRVITIQELAGPGVRLRVDANQAWAVATARAAVRAWLDAGVQLDFLEQPLPAWDVAGHAELRRDLPVPLLLDESVFTSHDLDRVIEAEAADLVNIKLAKCGGLSAGLHLARTATEAGLGVLVGSMMESELGVAAAAALAATVAPSFHHDLDAAWWSLPAAAPEPYVQGRFRLDPGSGLSAAVGRVQPGDGSPRNWTVSR